MKKGILLATLISLSLTAVVGPAFADNHWFKKYDHDDDYRWNYEEFCAWERAHHRHLTDKQLHELFDRYDRDHNGFWEWEEAKRYH